MTTKRRVLLDGNGSSQINVEGLGAYVPATVLLDVKQKLGTEIQQLKDQVNAMEVDLGIAIKTAATLNAVATELHPMSTAPRSDMIMLDAGLGFLTTGHWNETEQCWVYAAVNCNDGEGHDMYFENEYEKNPVGWLHIPRIDKGGE